MAKISKIFAERLLKILYWDVEKRHLDARKVFLESKLRSLADVDIGILNSLEDISKAECDILIVSASHIPGEDFEVWLEGLTKRMHGHIWVPALIFARLEQGQLDALLKKIVHQNWYFDIVDPEHMESLPIRVANLIRIHDHLQELQRYDAELSALSERLVDIESRLKDE